MHRNGPVLIELQHVFDIIDHINALMLTAGARRPELLKTAVRSKTSQYFKSFTLSSALK